MKNTSFIFCRESDEGRDKYKQISNNNSPDYIYIGEYTMVFLYRQSNTVRTNV